MCTLLRRCEGIKQTDQIIFAIQNGIADLLKQNHAILEKISINEELIKMLLVNHIIDSSSVLMEKMDKKLIEFVSKDVEIEDCLTENYDFERYMFGDKECFFAILKDDRSMKKIQIDYTILSEKIEGTCIIVFDGMSKYQTRRCKELKIQFWDKNKMMSNINFNNR